MPSQSIGKIRLRRLSVRTMPGTYSLLGKHHRLRAGDAQAGGQAGFEELVVGGPHEGIVDHVAALQNGVLEIRAVVGHLVRNAIYQHGIGAGLIHAGTAQFGVLGCHPGVAAVDLFDKRRRPRPFRPTITPILSIAPPFAMACNDPRALSGVQSDPPMYWRTIWCQQGQSCDQPSQMRSACQMSLLHRTSENQRLLAMLGSSPPMAR